MRRSRFVSQIGFSLVSAALVLASASTSAEDKASLAWLRNGKVEVRQLGTSKEDLDAIIPSARKKNPDKNEVSDLNSSVPLGSLWKLFVYAYLAQTQASEPSYVCQQKSSASTADERFCCNRGESVTRDSALARSCAPYFAPERLHLNQDQWRAFWQARTDVVWLQKLTQLRPETTIPLGELLHALNAIDPQARTQARLALLETGVEAYGRDAWTVLGTGIRYKTYSWHRENGEAFGGAAGWMADGTVFWFGARGSSHAALTKWATKIVDTLPPIQWQNTSTASDDLSCVDVDFFARYPLKRIISEPTQAPAKLGTMRGRYRLQFDKGNWLAIDANGELDLAQAPGKELRISGRFNINDYLARVIDREANPESIQAARALAIAARSYLVQNAHFEAGCWHIADTSSTQRVSPNPPSPKAREIAWFTDDIIVSGVPVHYHNNAASENRLSWQAAIEQEKQGWNFERILSAAYPRATIGTLKGNTECARLEAAETWLVKEIKHWHTKLNRETGYELLDEPLKVCALTQGHPYSDQRRMRIYARGWNSLEERITLAHEYLHLAFRNHPNGANEDYIERLARRLTEG